MTFDPEQLLALPPRETVHAYKERDTILYALGVGAGADDLPFVYEVGLKALPTMAVVLGYPGFWQKEPRYGIDWRRVLHGEQSIRLHAPLPVSGTIRSELTIDDIFDKGAERGAVLVSSRRLYDAHTGANLATVSQTSMLRGNGGFGGLSEGAPKPHALPPRAPDESVVLRSSPDQALIYRLSGDYNPLHADPAAATEAGFTRPILHGLCTFGVAGRAVLSRLCADDPSRLKRFDVRFSAPLYPGETLEVELWREGRGRAGLRARVLERDVVVLNNGYIEHE